MTMPGFGCYKDDPVKSRANRGPGCQQGRAVVGPGKDLNVITFLYL